MTADRGARRHEIWIVGALVLTSSLLGFRQGSPAHAASAETARKIVFDAYRTPEGNHEIYSMNPDGSAQTNLTQSPLYDVDPAIAPGGAKVAFVRQIRPGDHDLEIFVMNADGSDQRNLTDSSTIDRCPAWSPDARQIAFIRGEYPYGHPFEIYVMNADGSGSVNVSKTPTADDTCPTWSPDGMHIAYASEVNGSGDIVVVRYDGSERKNITNDSDSQWAPDWSPDGSRIAFSNWSTVEANRGIYTMTPEGGKRTKVVVGGSPTWSTDGQSIAYSGGHSIYRIDATGTRDPVALTTGAAGVDSDPDWESALVDLPPRHMPPAAMPARENCKVPGLVGLRLATAWSRIRRANCSVGRVTRVRSRQAGRVLGQSPRRSAIRPRHTAVRLLVGRR
jgi:TolB protein